MFSDRYFSYVSRKVQLEIPTLYPNIANYSRHSTLSNIEIMKGIVLWNSVPNVREIYIVVHEYEFSCWLRKQTMIE